MLLAFELLLVLLEDATMVYIAGVTTQVPCLGGQEDGYKPGQVASNLGVAMTRW